MEWVASTLHSTSEHGLSSITTADAHTSAASVVMSLYILVVFVMDNGVSSRVQLKCDGTRWRTGGEMKGKLANLVGSQYSSHYLGTCCGPTLLPLMRTPRLPVVD